MDDPKSDTKSDITSDEIHEFNTDMSSRLLYMNITGGVVWTILVLSMIKYDVTRKYLKNTNYLPYIIGFLFTSSLLIYHYIIEHKSIMNVNDRDEELEELKKSMESEKTIFKTFPMILFSLAMIMSLINIHSDTIRESIKKLLIACCFGIIFPFILNTLVIDHDNLSRLMVFENLEFISLFYAFGILMIIILEIVMNKK